MQNIQKPSRSHIKKHLSLFFILMLFINQTFAFEKNVENVLLGYPDSITQFAGCLMSVEKLKSEVRRQEFPDSESLVMDEGHAKYFAEHALELEIRAKELGLFNNNDILNAHMKSIRKRTMRPELLVQIEKELIGYDITLEKCIALPDLIKQKELEIEIGSNDSLPEINGVFDHCQPIASPINIPVRKKAAIVSTGTELLVWGGRVGDIMSQTGMRYDLLTDSWSLMAQTGDIPSARWGSKAVWSGTEMIIYGGTARTNTLSTDIFNGSRYNPSNNTWIAMSNTNIPEMSSGTAVMVGSTLVLWGDSFTTSGRYYPSVDLWDTMNSNNFPPKRSGHTAISTGTQLLVYGGLKIIQGQFVFQNDFWSYTPNQNSWTALPTPPEVISPPRSDHSAVYTGSEMIVFGGTTTGFSRITKGARFNFSNNSWSSISASGIPSKRAQHGSAWTGSEMIIWGGVDSFVYRGGATYNPSNNTWTSLPFGSTKSRRDFFSGWTGSEYIAFTNNTSGSLVQGDIYTKSTNSWRAMPTTFATPILNVEAYWVMDEFDSTSISSANGKRVLDICGNKDSKIVTANSPQSTVVGAQDNTTAITFNSGSDKLEYLAGYNFSDGGSNAGGEIDFNFDESLTLEALVKIPTSFTGVGSIIAKDVGPGQPSWWFRVANGSLQALVGDGANQPIVNGNTAINDGQWHQVALVRDIHNKTLSTYIDFKLDAQVEDTTVGSSTTSAATPITIAAKKNNARELVGDVDYVRITKGTVPASQMAYADRIVDIDVSLDSESLVEPDAIIVYTLTVTNKGPSTSTNVNITNSFSDNFVSFDWTCVASTDASCAASGFGLINDSVDIPVNGNVVYIINATLNSIPDSEVLNGALATTTEVDDVELFLTNNSTELTIKSEYMFGNGFE